MSPTGRRKSKYKPLLFTTTLRNPERLRWMLAVLKEYDGEELSNELIHTIAGKIITAGLYGPTKIPNEVKTKIKTGDLLLPNELEAILRDNPQNHKEAGFDKGWPSRFDTWFKMAKELGFVFYRMGEPIRFSGIGLKLVDSEHPEFEQQAFLNAFAKYQSNNPFRRVLNENAPLVLLLEVIKKLNSDPELNGTGISKFEIPLVIFWKDADSEALYQRIKKLRNDFGLNPSPEVIVDICQTEIMEGRDIKRSPASLTRDYPDEFIRKMRLTGLISIRGGGRFVDINTTEQEKVDYVIGQYSDYTKYESEEEYFDYISTIDTRLITAFEPRIPIEAKEQSIHTWMEVYGAEEIAKELRILTNKTSVSKDEILRYMSHPVRLEFLTALAIKTHFPNVTVIPNYPIDDEGLPTSTAGGAGDTGDIECFEDGKGVLVEVTMSQGRMQTVMEVWPIARHLEKFKTKAASVVCLFIAPTLYSDSLTQIRFLKADADLDIFPKTIGEFIEHVSSSEKLCP